MKASTKRMVEKYGTELCLRALHMNEDKGMGARGIAEEMDVRVNTADALINAGRELVADARATEAIAIERIRSNQDEAVKRYQAMIEDGTVWFMEGSIGRQAMDMLRTGACFLPDEPKFGPYRNRIPSRHEVQSGSQGSLMNSLNFYNLLPQK